MELLGSILNWLFVHTIYGIAGIAVVTYLLLSGLKKVVPRLPEPAYFGAAVFVVGLITLPSLPRYQFEDRVVSEIEGKTWMRVVNRTKWGSLTEPLTWVRAPIGSLTIVMPNSPIEGGFREAIVRYEEEEIVSMVDPDCMDFTILYSRPDRRGVFRYTTRSAVKMNDDQKKWYCEYDWSRERQAVLQEALKRVGQTAKKQ